MFVGKVRKFVSQKFVKGGARLVKLKERVREILAEDVFADPDIAIEKLKFHLREQRQCEAHVKKLKNFWKSGICSRMVYDRVSPNVGEVGGGNELKFFWANAELSAVVKHPNVFHVESSDDKGGIRGVHGGGQKVIYVNSGRENADK